MAECRGRVERLILPKSGEDAAEAHLPDFPRQAGREIPHVSRQKFAGNTKSHRYQGGPPVTGTIEPDMYVFSSEARKFTTAAISSGFASRPIVFPG